MQIRITTGQSTRLIWLLRGILIVANHLAAFAPLLLIAALYAFSWRVAALIGHWPVAWIDDPKFSAPNDKFSEFSYILISPLLMGTFISLILFPVLTIVLRHAYPRKWIGLLIIIYLTGWVLVVGDVGERLKWYVD